MGVLFTGTTEALFQFDGADGSSTVTDDSASPKTMTLVGSPTPLISTTQSQFGGASLNFANAASYATLGSSGEFDFLTDTATNWTIEFWLRLDSLTGGRCILAKGSNSGTMTCLLIFVSATGVASVSLYNGYSYGGNYAQTAAGAVAVNTWCHIAATYERASRSLRISCNGVASSSTTLSYVESWYTSNGLPLRIGRYSDNLYPITGGYIDCLRIIKGIPFYPDLFVLPTSALGEITSLELPVRATGDSALPQLNQSSGWSGSSQSAFVFTSDRPNGVVIGTNGRGRIFGTTKIKGTPNYAVHRKVQLIHDRSGITCRQMWSDPTTGYYEFTSLDMDSTYTVITYDYEHNFRAVIADNLTPEFWQ